MARFLTIRLGKNLVHVREESDYQFLVFNPHTNTGVRLQPYSVLLLAEAALGSRLEQSSGWERLQAQMDRIGIRLSPPEP